ncbi:MAG: DUF4143 domain-containing protein [Gammaproteobacteria bacterium]
MFLVNPDIQSASIKKALYFLNKAKLCHKVSNCIANGLPLGAGIKEQAFKTIFLDIGLSAAALGFNYNQIQNINDILFINRGGLAEQTLGQILRTIDAPYIEPALYYWHREEKGSQAEIDYLIQHGSAIVPIEVKAGSTGSLKSLHFFMKAKGFKLALRINSDLPSLTPVHLHEAQYHFCSLPFYLSGQIHRILDLCSNIVDFV